MINTIGDTFARFYIASGGTILLFFESIKEIRFGRMDRARILRQMVIVGWETVPLAMLIGLFTGMTVALGVGLVAKEWGQEEVIASVVAESIIKEMAPVFTAFIIAARVGSAMTAELGTMAVNEEINVLRVAGIRPTRYLAMPRILSAITMTSPLTAYSTILGLVGGALVTNSYFGVSFNKYTAETFRYITLFEIIMAQVKALGFGVIYSSVCCYVGLQTTGGAEGVGRSTTQAVVISLAGILIANYLMTRFLYG